MANFIQRRIKKFNYENTTLPEEAVLKYSWKSRQTSVVTRVKEKESDNDKTTIYICIYT